MTPLYRSRPTGFDIQPAVIPNAVPLNDFIYLSEGLSNSYLIVTSEGRIVVNSGMGFEAPTHRRAYDAIDTSPIRYILFTQGHVDHVGGADSFLEEGTEILAQAGNARHQEEDGRLLPFRALRSYFAWAHAIDKIRAAEIEGVNGKPVTQATPRATITFDDSYAFQLGGIKFELYATPGGETRESMVIWLPDHGICFTGNLFSALFGHFPNLVTVRGDRYRDALEFVESLERVRALKPERLFVGHHGPVDGSDLIQSELTRLRDAVMFVHDRTIEGMTEGRDVADLMREIELPSELEVGEGYGKVSWSVRAMWENYAGWFHHRSTTELYPHKSADIHADLIALAGADAVVERAREKVTAKDPVGAIALAEIVLTEIPSHEKAAAVALDAHRTLRDLSLNFWESAWLDRQIEDLESRLGKAK